MTVCSVYMLFVRYTCCLFGIHAVCSVYMLFVRYTCCSFGIHAVRSVYMLFVRYTCCLFGIHAVCSVYMLFLAPDHRGIPLDIIFYFIVETLITQILCQGPINYL